MATIVAGGSTSTLHVQRAITAGALGAIATWLVGAVMSLLGLARAELMSVIGIQVLAVTFHKNENAIIILGMLLNLLVGGFIVGVVFGFVRQRFHGNLEWTGVIFGVACWLVAQIIVIPLLGFAFAPVPGFFSLGAGVIAPIGSLISNVLYGIVVGEIYEPHEELH